MKYKSTAKILGKTYAAEGNTVYNSIEALKPGIVRGISIITVAKGKKQKDRVFSPTVTKRLFNGVGLTRDLALKSASQFYIDL